MRLLLDANVLLDCLVTEANCQARTGKAASDQVVDLCDRRVHQGLLAWNTLPILYYYYGKQNESSLTAAMLDDLMKVVEIPTVGHSDATNWRSYGITDFEDALQMASAIAGGADVIITRNVIDFAGAGLPAMTPEHFLNSSP